MSKRWAALPRGIGWLVAVAVVIVVLAVVWALFVPVADWLAYHDVGSVRGSLHETAVDNARGRLLTLGAGLFAAGALLFTARNYVLSREGQVTDRYSKAIEQLGSDKVDVCVGGIYALERIARDSRKDQRHVMEVLTAFVRRYSEEQWPVPAPAREPRRWTRPDVQAALTVVGRRDVSRDVRLSPEERPIDFYGATLIRANLVGADLGGAALRGANLTGARLERAALDGADLRDADLSDARLDRTTFGGARLDNVLWPRDAEVPEGWTRDHRTGRLVADSGPVAAG